MPRSGPAVSGVAPSQVSASLMARPSSRFGSAIDPLLDRIDLARGQRFATERHGWRHLTGDHKIQTTLRRIAGRENGAVIPALLNCIHGIQVETAHLPAAVVASDAVFGDDRRDVFGEFLSAESRRE